MTILKNSALTKEKSKTEAPVPGFSERFNYLLDKADFPPPQLGRYTSGKEVFGVGITTFRQWCTADKSPRNFNDLRGIVEILITRSKADTTASATIGWLLAGEGACPLDAQEEQLSAESYEVYDIIADIAQSRCINFRKLQYETRSKLVNKTIRYIHRNQIDKKNNSIELNQYIEDMLEIMTLAPA